MKYATPVLVAALALTVTTTAAPIPYQGRGSQVPFLMRRDVGVNDDVISQDPIEVSEAQTDDSTMLNRSIPPVYKGLLAVGMGIAGAWGLESYFQRQKLQNQTGLRGPPPQDQMYSSFLAQTQQQTQQIAQQQQAQQRQIQQQMMQNQQQIMRNQQQQQMDYQGNQLQSGTQPTKTQPAQPKTKDQNREESAYQQQREQVVNKLMKDGATRKEANDYIDAKLAEAEKGVK